MTSPDVPEEEYVSAESLPGAMIDDKYRVEGTIGRGGVGRVVRATNVALSQRVAIKMIRDDVPMQRELLDRFHREARAAAMIQSEHVARVLDVGRLPTGRPYIVMEYLEGEDLERIVSRGALPFTAAVDLTLQACEALAEAHRAGIIHRDLKPANLFVTRRADGAPLVKLLDFGISKIQPLTAARSGRTVETTSIMGSPGYMAPEQMKSTRDVDARADVWSLGAVLYEMLVGTPAFAGATMIEILDAIAACDPIPPSERQPGIPPALDLVIARCLTRDPDQRFASIADLAVALAPFASPAAAGLAERAVKISQQPMPQHVEPEFSALRGEPRPSAVTVVTPARKALSRQRMLAFSGGVAGACLLAALAFAALRSDRPEAGRALAASASAGPPRLPADIQPTAPAAPSTSPPAAAEPPPTAPAPPALRPSTPSAAMPRTPARRAPPAMRPAPLPSPDSPFGDRK